jgi:hypothetical protein
LVAYVQPEDPPGVSPITTVGRFDTVVAARLPTAMHGLRGDYADRQFGRVRFQAPSATTRSMPANVGIGGDLEQGVRSSTFGVVWRDPLSGSSYLGQRTAADVCMSCAYWLGLLYDDELPVLHHGGPAHQA